jgi:hypothetical protein
VAEERALPIGRARTLAIGSGLTAAVSLPLILHSTLPDSTMPFAALTLAACLLITRIRRVVEAIGSGAGRFGVVPGAALGAIGRSRPIGLLVGLGVVLGLAALTRNEAAWLALVWVGFAWVLPVPRRERLVLIAIPAAVALLIFGPWMVRDWLVFGSPLPGQALTNAFSIQGTDIFAWSDPPTVSRYLAIGAGRLLDMRVVGVEHNLFDVLLLPGAPLSAIGLVALPWMIGTRALRPLVAISAVIFLVTSLLFPVSTTWGTFLHAAGAVHVLLIISALLALDRLILAIGRRRRWTRPVAWLAPALTISGALLFSAIVLPSFGTGSVGTERTFEALKARLAEAGMGPATGATDPIITDAPIWLPYVVGGTGLALPFESPTSVLDLARHFHASIVVVVTGDHPFPGLVAAGGTDAACFEPVDMGAPADPSVATALAHVHVYRIVCQ